MLDELSTLEHGDLGDPITNADAHHVTANGLASALPATAALEGVRVELHGSIVGHRLHGPVPAPLAALATPRLLALVATGLTPATTSAPTSTPTA